MPTAIAKTTLERRVEELPVLPTTVVKMLSLDPRSERWFEDLVSLVQHEPTYAARVLVMANSAAIRRSTPATGITEAVLRLGANTTSRLVTALSVVRVFVPSNSWERSLWVHAITVASLSRALAERADLGGYRPDDAYLCGLLHDIGRFILFQEAPEALRRVEEAEWSNPADLVRAEAEICGFDHTKLGAMAAQRWGLPESVVDVIRRHHQRQTSTDPLSKLIDVVQAADRLDFFDVSPNHRSGDASPIESTPEWIERIARVLPRWYPHPAAAVVPWVHGAMQEARASVDAIFPGA